jgi:hypothetical protein
MSAHNLSQETRTSRLEDVLNYNCPEVVARLQQKLDLSDEAASQLFIDTRKFLYLCGTYNGRWVPSRDIDAGWHEFILFTREYNDFCFKHFGRFIHHSPTKIGEKTDPLSANRTKQAAIRVFGTLSKNWTYYSRAGLPIDVAADVFHLNSVASVPCSENPGCNSDPGPGGSCTSD